MLVRDKEREKLTVVGNTGNRDIGVRGGQDRAQDRALEGGAEQAEPLSKGQSRLYRGRQPGEVQRP